MRPSVRNLTLFAKSVARRIGSDGDQNKLVSHSRNLCTVPNTQPTVEFSQVRCDQLKIPDLDKEFKGLETDFPCLVKHEAAGPEPSYHKIVSGYKLYKHETPFQLKYRRGVLPQFELAYETWGELNEAKDNAVILSTGLSASSHARSHEENPQPGWWEKFVGPGCALDTNRYFVICTNNLGGCYGTTGPSSISPITEKPYGTTFPMVSVEDMVRTQFLLLDHLGIDKVYAAVGSSLGGMMSLTSGVLFPDRVRKVVSISSCARTGPTSISLRYLQRKAIMLDPDWQRGHYYNTNRYPRTGMKLARELATLSYRSGPEWEQRFGRQRIDENEEPSLCPYFMIENYLDYQGESFAMKLDPNTLLYISKAMDLFDLSETFGSLKEALSRVKCPVMVIGVKSDILFPVKQQREIANGLQESGNHEVTYYELTAPYGHDTFLLELNTVGTGIKGFLETEMAHKGRAKSQKTFQETK